MKISRRDLAATVAGGLAAIVVAGGAAWAAVPGEGTVSGCFQKNEGQLRVSDNCRPAELPITWSESGVPGPRGLKGEQGDPGDPGRNGSDGRNGIDAAVFPEPAGQNCPAGGAKVIAGGVTYVCNAVGLPVDPGPD